MNQDDYKTQMTSTQNKINFLLCTFSTIIITNSRQNSSTLNNCINANDKIVKKNSRISLKNMKQDKTRKPLKP